MFLRMLLLIPFLAAGAHSRASEFFNIEVPFTSEDYQNREYLASTADRQTKMKLLHSSKMMSINSGIQFCKSLGGTPSSIACVRDAGFEVTHRWGGRIGHSVFLANVQVSLKCRLEEKEFNWVEKAWFQHLYPLMDPCPAQNRVFSKNGAHYSR